MAESSHTPLLTLKEAYRIAQQNNPHLHALQANLDVVSSERMEAGARLNPILTTDAGMVEDTYRLGLSQQFELGGQRQKRLAIADNRITLAAYAWQTQLSRYMSDVRQAFMRLYRAQVHHNTLRELLQELHQLQASTASQATRSTSALSRLQQLHQQLLTQESQRMAARQQLELLLRRSLPDHIQLIAPNARTELHPEPSLTPSPRQLLLETAEQTVALAKAERIPNILLGAGVSLVTEPSRRFGTYALGGMSLPLWNRQQGSIAKAMAIQKQLRLELQAHEKQQPLIHRHQQETYQHYQRHRLLYEQQLLPQSHQLKQNAFHAYQAQQASFDAPLEAAEHHYHSLTRYWAILDQLDALAQTLEPPAIPLQSIPDQPPGPAESDAG